MDRLSIFVRSEVPWPDLVLEVTELIGSEGVDKSDELGKLHVWKALGIEFSGIYEPGYEDDQGIAFSTFNFQLSLQVCELKKVEETSRFYHAVARYLFVRLQELFGGNVLLVRNLQSKVG